MNKKMIAALLTLSLSACALTGCQSASGNVQDQDPPPAVPRPQNPPPAAGKATPSAFPNMLSTAPWTTAGKAS